MDGAILTLFHQKLKNLGKQRDPAVATLLPAKRGGEMGRSLPLELEAQNPSMTREVAFSLWPGKSSEEVVEIQLVQQ